MVIGIVDYGMGNLRSIEKKLTSLDLTAFCSSDPERLKCADKLILPGVGHFAKGMNNLKNMGLIPFLNDFVISNKKPVLGICLGMQLFSDYSEEGDTEGLGWISGYTKKIKPPKGARPYKVPHMGWNTLQDIKRSFYFDGVDAGHSFYFVHSYHLLCEEKQDMAATTEYGIKFCSALLKENILGFQFHPEKSYDAGFKLIRNFINLQTAKAST